MTTRPLAVVLLTVLCEGVALAQSPLQEPLVGPGERVRVTTSSVQVDGVLAGVDENRLIIRPRGGGSDITVPRAAVTRIEWASGRRARGRYAGFGALAGLAVGALAGLASSTGCEPNQWFCSAGRSAAAGGLFGAGAGAAVGAALPPAPRWIDVHDGALTAIPQPIPPPARPKLRYSAVAFGAGGAWSNLAGDLEGAMRRAGFDDTSPGIDFGSTEHPHSARDDFHTVWFNAHYQIRPQWEVGVAIERSRIGRTYGYADPFQFLAVRYEATGIGGVVSRTLGPLRVGAGPSWYSARSSVTTGVQSRSDSRIGAMAEAGVKLPVRTRLYLDLNVQYHYLGRATVGPFRPPLVFGPARLFPETNVRFNHWFVGVGPGVRF